MAKFKNKKTGKIVVENLIYYVNKFRNHPDYVEIKEDKTTSKKNKEVAK